MHIPLQQLFVYQMELAEEAIFGQRSAASFATGPVIPDPFISPLGFTITPALSIHYSIPSQSTLKVEIDSILSSPALSLSHHDSRHNYGIRESPNSNLPFLRSSGFPFFTEAMNISPAAINNSSLSKPTSGRQSVETSTSTSDRNHVQVLGTSVISTVDHSTSGKTKSHSELVSSSTSTSYIVKTHLTNHTTLSSSHSDKRSIWTTRKLKSTIPLLFINNRSYRISLNNDFSAIGTNIDRRT